MTTAFRAQIHKASASVPHLREQKTATIAKLRIVGPKLMTVITKRQGVRQIAFEWRETTEMAYPFAIAEITQPDGRCPTVVAEAQDRFGKIRRRHRIAKPIGKARDRRVGAVARGLRIVAHTAIVRMKQRRRKWRR